MSKMELRSLVESLSFEQRRELEQLLQEVPLPMMTEEELANDPAIKLMEEISRMPPSGLPSDFAINHDYYIHGGPKREE